MSRGRKGHCLLLPKVWRDSWKTYQGDLGSGGFTVTDGGSGAGDAEPTALLRVLHCMSKDRVCV